MAVDSKRVFRKLNPANRGYSLPESAKVNKELYNRLSLSGWSNIVKRLTAPKRSAAVWEMKAGQICRIVVESGPQVGDLNLWNLHQPKKERFYSGKTRQIHGSHLSTYDRLWSNLPFLNPMATITQDSLSDYGIDSEGCSVHDVIGTRCDPYTFKLVNGKDCRYSCHQSLTKAIEPYGLEECDVHDVFNVFMSSGFDKETHEYILKEGPVKKGDYLEFLAEMDLLAALSACPQGNILTTTTDVDETICYPLEVYIGQPSEELIKEWKA